MENVVDKLIDFIWWIAALLADAVQDFKDRWDADNHKLAHITKFKP